MTRRDGRSHFFHIDRWAQGEIIGSAIANVNLGGGKLPEL